MKPIFLVGFMGCGKSTFGRKLAKSLGYAFIDLDTYIEEQQNCTVPQIFALQGESVFRELEHKAILDLSNQVHAVIATGGGAPCYLDNIKLMNQFGTTVYLQLSPEKLAERLKSDSNERPLLSGKSDDQLVDFISAKLEERLSFYSQSVYTVDADHPEELLNVLNK